MAFSFFKQTHKIVSFFKTLAREYTPLKMNEILQLKTRTSALKLAFTFAE